MRSLSNILEILCLTSEQTRKFQACLSEFDALADTDKDDHRLSTAETLFPVVFGENVAIETDSRYIEFSETTW